MFRSSKLLSKWSNKGLSHVAFATKNIEETMELFKVKFKIDSAIEPFEFKSQKVKVGFLHLGDSSIEIIEPLATTSPISKFLDKNPNGGMHHVCFYVDDIQNAITDLESKNVRALGQPRPGALGKDVVFLHPKDTGGVLVELEEHK
eukprot:NODE_198_length_15297_cov_0.486182.p12 type:complete len:146 gc:universal NODE_198_length_15297_cov_0.486182:6803-6366(-)